MKQLLLILLLFVTLNIFAQPPDFSKYISKDINNVYQELKNDSIKMLSENRYGWDYYNVKLSVKSNYIDRLTIKITLDNKQIYKNLIKDNNIIYDSKVYYINYRHVQIINFKTDTCYYVTYIELNN